MKAVKNTIKKIFFVCVSCLPAVLFAGVVPVVNDLVNKISDSILKPLILLMFALATLVFIWGVQTFIGAADDVEARGKGAQQMIWGIVGMVVMISAYALKEIIMNTVKVL